MYGGSRFYVPTTPSPLLLRLFGALASDFTEAWGGNVIALPLPDVNGARRIEARRMRAEGMTVREIGRRLNVSERSAWRLLAEQ